MFPIFQGGSGALPWKRFDYLECGRSHLINVYLTLF